MKSKIKESEFKREWTKGKATIYYHDVTFEGEDKPWNIGAKEKNPDFLEAGKTLEYEITDNSKRKIKRSSPQMGNKKDYGSPYSSFKSSTTKSPTFDENSPSLIRALDLYDQDNLLFLDIETARVEKNLKKGSQLEEAWLYKSRYENEVNKKTGEPMTPEEYYIEKAALYAVFGRVVTIVVARIVDGEIKGKSYADDGRGEAVMLQEFNDDVNAMLKSNPSYLFTGWANVGFDQPYLAKRMMVHGIKPNLLLDQVGRKPWEVIALDLKELWKGQGFYPDSLLATATALGLPSPKNNMDGSQVSDAFYAGKIDDIVKYCKQDVKTTINVYRKLSGRGVL